MGAGNFLLFFKETKTFVTTNMFSPGRATMEGQQLSSGKVYRFSNLILTGIQVFCLKANCSIHQVVSLLAVYQKTEYTSHSMTKYFTEILFNFSPWKCSSGSCRW